MAAMQPAALRSFSSTTDAKFRLPGTSAWQPHVVAATPTPPSPAPFASSFVRFQPRLLTSSQHLASRAALCLKPLLLSPTRQPKSKQQGRRGNRGVEVRSRGESEEGDVWSPGVMPNVQQVAGSRAGLYRSPVSGGVESATSAHGLPRPAVAVRNLIEQAQFAHLCTIMSRMHHRRKGYPFGSLVDFATDADGHPIFLLSSLGIHSRNLLSDPRCTVVVQIPGWSGLANARATIFGDVYPLPPSQQDWARRFYAKRHQQGASQQWGNFHFYRMDAICDIYFVGGFGTVAWIDVPEYVAATPDRIATENVEQTLQRLNDLLGGELLAVLAASAQKGAAPVDDASFISIDSKGVDIRVRHGAQFNVQRLSFEAADCVDSCETAEAALRRILNQPVQPLANGLTT